MKLKRKSEINILRSLFAFGIISFIPLMRKKPTKEMNEWLIVFFIKSYISSYLDIIVNKKGFVKYPVNLFKIFNTSVLFDYLLFPLACVYYNQLTKNSTLKGILTRVLFFSVPIAFVEDILVKNTKLIKYKKGWNSIISFISLTLTFLVVRALISVIRYFNKSPN
ncbi:CBO0543 family protein [Metabacillus litoralis]|uniref:CBO0543 family protein n=1 Tax=Metabacillus litoralis TaxID=152268 RepID=UPI00203CAFD8|nr:CBO0543 family protein [Metabacillus litoralis]